MAAGESSGDASWWGKLASVATRDLREFVDTLQNDTKHMADDVLSGRVPDVAAVVGGGPAGAAGGAAEPR